MADIVFERLGDGTGALQATGGAWLRAHARGADAVLASQGFGGVDVRVWSTSSDITTEPLTVPAFGLGAALLAGMSFGSGRSLPTGRGQAQAGVSSRGYQRPAGIPDGQPYGMGESRMRAWSGGWQQRAVEVPADVYDDVVYAQSDIALGGTLGARLALLIAERMRFAAPGRAMIQMHAREVSSIALRDTGTPVIMLLIEEGVVLGEAASYTYQRVMRVVETLLLSGQAHSVADALATVQSAIVFAEVAVMFAYERVVETIVVDAAVNDRWEVVGRVLESLLLSAEAQADHHITALVTEHLALSFVGQAQADMRAAAEDGIAFAVHLTLDNDAYTAWVFNTVSRGLSQYDNYPFNSYARVGERYYGATSTGLFDLDGSSDIGIPISARLRMGLTDFGQRHLKQVPDAYVGYSADGTLMFKVVSIHPVTGAKQAAHYRMHPMGAATVRENRVQFGRGVKSVDWDFEIENVDGKDFELDYIEFRPVAISRRTRR